jgi:hypothetical protein
MACLVLDKVTREAAPVAKLAIFPNGSGFANPQKWVWICEWPYQTALFDTFDRIRYSGKGRST